MRLVFSQLVYEDVCAFLDRRERERLAHLWDNVALWVLLTWQRLERSGAVFDAL